MRHGLAFGCGIITVMASATYSGKLAKGERSIVHANYSVSDLTVTVHVRIVEARNDPKVTTAKLQILKDGHDTEGQVFPLRNDGGMVSFTSSDQNLLILFAEANIEFTVFVH